MAGARPQKAPLAETGKERRTPGELRSNQVEGWWLHVLDTAAGKLWFGCPVLLITHVSHGLCLPNE